MELEILLYHLHQHRDAISQKLDDDACRKLTELIENSLSSHKVSKEFYFFCGKHLSEFIKDERIRSDSRFTPTETRIYANELIKALKKQLLPQSQKNEKEKK